jgi:molybdopterin-binding protein
MSQIIARIKKINSIDNSLNIVEFDFAGLTLKMMSLDLNKDVQIGKKVQLSVKPTNIAIAKNLSGEISLSNQILAKIQSIENGVLLSSIILEAKDTSFESIITADSSKRMNLQKNDEVIILIKASDLSIQEVLND